MRFRVASYVFDDKYMQFLPNHNSCPADCCFFLRPVDSSFFYTYYPKQAKGNSIFDFFILLSHPISLPVKLLFATLLLCLLSATADGQTPRALLIAVDKYPEQSGWNEIHATNDLSIVVPMLRAHRFEPDNITLLTNQEATKKNIVAALLDLANVSRKGDCIYLHFSAHGQLMLDDNGDEPDGYDESLIPYDAPRRFKAGIYEGENHLRDDELATFLDKIRRKVGPDGNLVVAVDACHSGSADRNKTNDTYIRGTTYIFAPENHILPDIDSAKLVSGPKTTGNMAPLTVLSACLPDQINYEHKASDGKYYGTLTYAICSAQSGDGATQSVAAFFDKLKDRVQKLAGRKNKMQTPDLQSTHEDKTFRIGL